MPVEPIDLLWGDTRHVEPRPVSSRAQYQGPITMNGQRSLVLSGPPVQLAPGRNIPLVVPVLVYHEKVVDLRDDEAVIVDAETPEEVALLTDVYADLKRKLTARGIPAHEIRFVHEAKTREARFRLFQAANDGLARIIVGSTAKLGTGVNVQKRLAALHHLDAPWRPMDVEQRDGRGKRQGNEVYGPVFDTAGTLMSLFAVICQG